MRKETPGLWEIHTCPFTTSFVRDKIKGRWWSSSAPCLASPLPCMVTRSHFPVRSAGCPSLTGKARTTNPYRVRLRIWKTSGLLGSAMHDGEGGSFTDHVSPCPGIRLWPGPVIVSGVSRLPSSGQGALPARDWTETQSCGRGRNLATWLREDSAAPVWPSRPGTKGRSRAGGARRRCRGPRESGHGTVE